MSRAEELRRRLRGEPEPAPATPGEPASVNIDRSLSQPASEEGTEAKLLSMSDLIRARPRRVINIFGQPTDTSADEASEATKVLELSMNEILRSHRRRPDEPADETGSDA